MCCKLIRDVRVHTIKPKMRIFLIALQMRILIGQSWPSLFQTFGSDEFWMSKINFLNTKNQLWLLSVIFQLIVTIIYPIVVKKCYVQSKLGWWHRFGSVVYICPFVLIFAAQPTWAATLVYLGRSVLGTLHSMSSPINNPAKCRVAVGCRFRNSEFGNSLSTLAYLHGCALLNKKQIKSWNI